MYLILSGPVFSPLNGGSPLLPLRVSVAPTFCDPEPQEQWDGDRSLEGTGGQGALGISGVKGGIPNQLLEKEGNQAMPKPDSPTNMTSTARGTEETYPG